MAKNQGKRPEGRPTKYDPAYCDQVIVCLAEGHSVTAFAGRIQVARSTVFKWADEIPEFSDALKVGQAKAVEFWEGVLVKIAKDGGGNATAAIFGLKNRASDDWADRVQNEHSGPNGAPIAVQSTPDLSKLTKEQRDTLRSILGTAFGGPESDVAGS